ncbi:MAG: hypothetical protein ACP5Q4_06755 [Candidatus Caldatribacteriaceae bacterium]
MITREDVVQQIRDYLNHRITLQELVQWAEEAMMEEELEESHASSIRDALARLGLADFRAFGLTWEDCEILLKSLGYRATVEVLKL